MKTAILVMAHGSRIAEANDAARQVATMLGEITDFDIIEVAFRELPDLVMEMGRHLGAHRKLAEIVAERIDESLAEKGWN